MEKSYKKRKILKSIGEAGVVATGSVLAGCIGSNNSKTETGQTEAPTSATESGTTRLTQTVPPSSEPSESEEPTLCSKALEYDPIPGGEDTATPECANVELDIVVGGRAETPTPTDSTSTPYDFVKEIKVTVNLPGEDGISLNVCVKDRCNESRSVSKSINLPSKETEKKYVFGPFGYSCIEDSNIWIGGCRRE